MLVHLVVVSVSRTIKTMWIVSKVEVIVSDSLDALISRNAHHDVIQNSYCRRFDTTIDSWKDVPRNNRALSRYHNLERILVCRDHVICYVKCKGQS
jgi:hypothetical protein